VLYNSFEFILVFLPAALLLYFGAAAVSRGLANAVLCALSLAFYAWWDWRNLFVLAGSILVNFVVGALIKRHSSKPILVLGIALNLGVLAYLLKANNAPAGLDSLRPDTTVLRGRKIAVRLP